MDMKGTCIVKGKNKRTKSHKYISHDSRESEYDNIIISGWLG